MDDTVSVSDVSSLLDDVEKALVRDLPALRRELGQLLPLYNGIPTAVDVFDVLGLHGDEDRHTAFLAWLLDPAGTHRLDDWVLRRFLHLVEDPALEPLLASRGPLDVWVRPWLELPGTGIPDLVLVVANRHGRAVALVVEAKIHAGLTPSPGNGWQTIAYARALAKRRDLEELVLAPCRASSSLDVDSSACDVVFVFLRSNPDQEADPDHQLDGVGYRNVEYPDVERMLARLVTEVDVGPQVRSLVQQFRTSLLAGALPEGASLEALEELRRLRRRSSTSPDYHTAAELRSRLAGFGGTPSHE